jgi:hypothetical protein
LVPITEGYNDNNNNNQRTVFTGRRVAEPILSCEADTMNFQCSRHEDLNAVHKRTMINNQRAVCPCLNTD